LAQVKSPTGGAILRVRLTDNVPRSQVFAPMHWTGETAPSGRIDALVPGFVDPVSGQPESKAAVASVTRFDAAWYGFAVSVTQPTFNCDYWARARTERGYRAELAGIQTPADWEAEARTLFDAQDAQVSMLSDPGRGVVRLAFERQGRLIAALFVASSPVAVMRDYVATRLGQSAAGVLLGRTPADVPDPGPTLCSCFGVGLNTIAREVEAEGLQTVEEVGEALRAGTNCGSCRPEIAALMAQIKMPQAAE
ncbi:MAG: (2Fe-2S)-binding protein, partial [Pseudomonadota bacterium]